MRLPFSRFINSDIIDGKIHKEGSLASFVLLAQPYLNNKFV